MTAVFACSAAAPNLLPYQPSGWSDKIVVSKITGTTTDSSPLTAVDTLYVDWAVINNGTTATTNRFYTELYVDGVVKNPWFTDPPLNANSPIGVQDYSIGTLSPGSHAIRIKTDSSGTISEVDEGDNEYTKTITIQDDDPNDQLNQAILLGPMIQTQIGTGAIDSATDVDMYSFTVAADQRISFDIDQTTGFDSYIRLFDSNGNQLAANDNARGPGPEETSNVNSYLEYTFNGGGTYYLGVSGSGNTNYNAITGAGDVNGSIGSYTLVVSPGIAGTARVNGVATDYLVDIIRLDRKAIDPSKQTWIVIHGRNSSRTNANIAELASSLASTRSNDQVLTLDWSGAASYFGLAGFGGEDAIQNVGIWAAAALQGKGFAGTNLNLAGHSWGSYVADELAERIPGGVNTITALDAAENVPGGYSPETPGEIDFTRDSLFSWAFHSDGTAGSNVTPTTADEAFIVYGSDHSLVVFLFAYMLMNPSDAVGRYFLLSYLLLAQHGPWVPDQYISQLGIEDPVGGYEAEITARADGTTTQSIRFVTNAPSLNITSHANGATVTSSPILLSGIATDAGRGGSGIASVVVNGIRANNDTAVGTAVANWSRSVDLSVGSNLITVVARDNGANQAALTNAVTINYTPLPPPTLAIGLSNGSVTLAWHVDYSDFALQQADSFDSPINWTAVSTSPTIIGSSNAVALSISQTIQFFRLRRP